MKHIAQELTKLLIFTIIWGVPPLLAYLGKSPYYLFFYILSLKETPILFSHYEKLNGYERTEED